MKPRALAPGESSLTLKVTLLIVVALVAVLAIAAFLSLTNNSNNISNNSSSLAGTAQVSPAQGSGGESQGKSESKGEGKDAGGPESANIISSIEEIPLPEDARIINRGCLDPPDKCWLVLNISVSEKEAATFYRELLTNAGWSIIEERTNPEDNAAFSLSYGGNSEPSDDFASQNNPDDPSSADSADEITALPLVRRYIYVSVVSNPVDSGTEVHLEYERWPDPREVPVYPGAEEITVNWNVIEYSQYEQVTRFVTRASPAEVEAYYKHVMTPLGWVYRDYEPTSDGDPIRSGIYFRYGRGVLGGGRLGASVTLFTDPMLDNRTQVQLIAGGTEVEELWLQEQQQGVSPTP